MNIALLCNSHAWGGLEMNIYKYALWFREFNNNVVIICPEDSRIYSEALNAGLAVEKIKTRFKHADIIGALSLKKILKKHKSEAVIISYSKDIHITVLADIIPGYHFKKAYLQGMSIGVNKKDFIHNFLYSKLDFWISTAVFLEENTLERTTMKKEKIHVIPYAIDIDKFINYETSVKQGRASLKLPEDIFLVGIIGRIDRLKGHHVLVEAIKILKAKGEPIHALIVGDETYTSDKEYSIMLRNMVMSNGLDDRIHFRPFMEDPRLAFKILDIYAMTSLNESFGMVTVEAMISGIPVVGAKAGATQFIIQDGDNGLLFKSEDANDLAEKILLIKNQPQLAQTLTKNAIQSVKENYSNKSVCDKIVTLIKPKL